MKVLATLKACPYCLQPLEGRRADRPGEGCSACGQPVTGTFSGPIRPVGLPAGERAHCNCISTVPIKETP